MRKIGTLLAFCGVALCAGSALSATFTWNGGAGTWSDPARWTPNGAPDGLDVDVFIDGGKPVASAVTLDTSPSISSLTLDSDDQVIVPGPQSLFINGGDSAISGTINVNSGGLLFLLPGNFVNNGTIQGTGADTSIVIDLGAGGSFSGAGTLAISAGATLQLASGTFSRAAFTLSGATVDLVGSVLDNTAQTLQPGPGSTVLLESGSLIVGGALIGSPGTVQVVDNGALSDLSFSGTLTHLNGATTSLIGTITNPAPATFSTATPGAAYSLVIATDVTLAGTGSLTLTDNASIDALAGGETLTNAAGHLLRIAGPTQTHGITFVNAGTLDIVSPTGSLDVFGDLLFADGTLREQLGTTSILHVNGNLTLGGAADALILSGGLPGHTYLVADYTGALSGVFEDVTTGYTLTYDSANHQILATLAVPEPAALGLLLSGAIPLLAKRKRRR